MTISGGEGGGSGGRFEGGAAGSGVDAFVGGGFGFVGVLWRVVVVRGVGHAGEVLPAAAAGIDEAGAEEAVEGFAGEGQALGLRDDGWGPLDAEPGEVFEHGGGEVGAGAVRVEVFVA